LAGYFDPLAYLTSTIVDIEPTLVRVTTDEAEIRSGVLFEAREAIVGREHVAEQIIGRAQAGQQFVAFAKYDGWFQIYFPSDSGTATGWINAVEEVSGELLEVVDENKREQGVNVRNAPSTEDISTIARVWDQELVAQSNIARNEDDDCDAEWWHETYLINGSSSLKGWVCGQFIRRGYACTNLLRAGTGAPPPEGYGAAYNVFSAERELAVQVVCNENTLASLQVGSGLTNQYIFHIGYVWNSELEMWEQIDLSGGGNKISEAWFDSSAAGVVDIGRPEFRDKETVFVIGHVCTRTGTEWKCGCRDDACTQTLWQLQQFRRQ
jgi:hypothetical protein